MWRWGLATVFLLLGCESDEPTPDAPTDMLRLMVDRGLDMPSNELGQPEPPGLGKIVGDPCVTQEDCEPPAVGGVRCLAPGARIGGRMLRVGICSVPCEFDDECPKDTVCSLERAVGPRYCTPGCVPEADGPGDGCPREDMLCAPGASCQPRCVDDTDCLGGLSCLPHGECRNLGPADPATAQADGASCVEHTDCRHGALCFSNPPGQMPPNPGRCVMPGCDLGGFRACQGNTVCVTLGGFSQNPAVEKRVGSLCLPVCQLDAPESCPEGMLCYPPETEFWRDAPAPVCFAAERGATGVSGDRPIGSTCETHPECRDGLDRPAGFHDCLGPRGLFDEGVCTTLSGVCANESLRGQGICGESGGCFSVRRLSDFTCHRACRPDATQPECPAGQSCHPYLAGQDELGVCLPSCSAGASNPICDRNGPAGACRGETCPVWFPCETDADCPGGIELCFRVAGGVNAGQTSGVCQPPCTAQTVQCHPNVGRCERDNRGRGRCDVEL